MVRHKAPDLFHKLSLEVLRKGGLETFPSLTMSNLAVSFARAGNLMTEGSLLFNRCRDDAPACHVLSDGCVMVFDFIHL